MLNRRRFFGGLAALFGIGAAHAAGIESPTDDRLESPIEITLKWGSYHCGGNWKHYMSIDDLTYVNLYYLHHVGKDKPFGYCLQYVTGQQREYQFATLEEAVRNAEHQVLRYLMTTYHPQLPFKVNMDHGTLFEDVATEVRQAKEKEEFWKRLEAETSGYAGLGALG